MTKGTDTQSAQPAPKPADGAETETDLRHAAPDTQMDTGDRPKGQSWRLNRMRRGRYRK